MVADETLQAIYQLLLKQQKLAEDTARLVDALVSDVGRTRDHSERLAIVMNRVDSIERMTAEWDRKRSECSSSVIQQIQQLETKREATKDRISQIELDLQRRMSDSINPVEKAISELREKIAFNAGKYGGIVALIISVLMMLVQWVIGHGTHPTKGP